MNICIFGASITCGFNDFEEGGFVSRISYYYYNKAGFKGTIYNLGVNGNTTEDYLARLDAEAKARKADVIILALSTNDTQFFIKENRFRVPIEKYRKNVEDLLKIARKHTENIFIASITPVDDKKTSPLAWNKNKIVKNENIELYNSEAKKICEKENIDYIDLYNEMLKKDYKKFLDDGLHPNSEGHAWIADKIISCLDI